MADKQKLPDAPERLENAAEGSRNMRHPDGVVQQRVQLTPPGEPTHVPQRKHDEPGYATISVAGADVPAFNPDAPPVTLREDELNINPFGTQVGDDAFGDAKGPPGLTRLTEPADAPPVKIEGDTATQQSSSKARAK